MKLVTEFLTPGEAELAASSLEAAGIVTFISNKDTAQFPVPIGTAGGIGLWVVVDDQLWDAQQLLENPEHEVQSVLTESQRQEIRESVADQGMSGALGMMFQLLGVAVLVAVLVFLITRF